MKNKLILSALVLTLVVGGGLVGANYTFAQISQGAPNSSLVQKIADKFGLNKNDVQAVFDQNHADRKAQMQAKFEAQLDQYVKDGKLTDAQKQLILAKHKELETQRESDFANKQNMTEGQREATWGQRDAAEQGQEQALNDWAKQNGIDPQYLGFGMKGHWGHGDGK